MLRYESAVHVERSPATVWRYLAEPSNQVLWSDVPMRQLKDGPLTSGSRMEVTLGMGLIKAKVGLELTAVEPGRRMAFRSFSGPLQWEGEYRLTPSGTEGSDLSQRGSLAFTGLWRLIEPIAGAEMRRGEVKELERLKVVVEEREPRTASRPTGSE
jgi:polyketide cyclase/dehydrase/lipid transport protein